MLISGMFSLLVLMQTDTAGIINIVISVREKVNEALLYIIATVGISMDY